MTETELKEQNRRDGLVAEWILRIASLEKVLIAKGIIKQEELAKVYLESVAKLGELISIVESKDKKEIINSIIDKQQN